jgi:hypothetical protein
MFCKQCELVCIKSHMNFNAIEIHTLTFYSIAADDAKQCLEE